MGDEIVLNYQNSLLRKSDVDLLHGSQWLNDQIIGFWFEYLENCCGCQTVCFVSPEVAQLMKLGFPADISTFIETLNLSSKTFVFLPINDSVSLEQPGGSHWSLLIYEKSSTTFFHLDSLGKSNSNQAKRIAKNLNLSKREPIELNCLQQENSWDCGVFVCSHADHVINHCLKDRKELSSLPILDKQIVSQQRSHMLQTITRLSLQK